MAKWYHGTTDEKAEAAGGILRPGMPTRYGLDIPRHDSVYITTDLAAAREYAAGGAVCEVEDPDPARLLLDEDVVSDLLLHHGPDSCFVQTAFLELWNEDAAEVGLEPAPDFAAARREFNESDLGAEYAERMKAVAERLKRDDPAGSAKLVERYGRAAHVGPLRVVRRVMAAKAPPLPLLFQIEIPPAKRGEFWNRPADGTLEFWAFSERPRCWVNERIIFTFDRRPVAEARVHKVEGPGQSKCDRTGQFEKYHKVFWDPKGFRRYALAKAAGGPSWGHGHCWEWALARQELRGGELYVVVADYDDGGEAAPEYAHAFVSHDGGRTGVDFMGERPVAEIVGECGFLNGGANARAERMAREDFEQFFPDEEAVEEAKRQMAKTADRWDAEGFWAGEGGAASGVLPVCPSTGRVCLAWRSRHVDKPNCWGTLGGAVQEGMGPQESAKAELREETGYRGGVTLLPAHVFSSAGGFKYHNYVGVVGAEFGLAPESDHGWETASVEWLPWAEVLAAAEREPSKFHPGLLELLAKSRKQIEGALGAGAGGPKPKAAAKSAAVQGTGEWEGWTVTYADPTRDDGETPESGQDLPTFGVYGEDIIEIEHRQVPLADLVHVEAGKDPRAVAELAEKMKTSRRVEAVSVLRHTSRPDRLLLEHGHHRALAAESLGFTTIPCNVVLTGAKSSVSGAPFGSAAKLSSGDDTVDIPVGVKGRYGWPVQRHWFHDPRARGLNAAGGVSAYPLGGMAGAKEIAAMFPDTGADDRFVYLSPYPLTERSLKIDIGRLDTSRIRQTGQAEGYAVYKGDIPPEAIVREGKTAANEWMTGMCYYFALALRDLMPDAEFVWLGAPRMPHHVGLRKGTDYYDARGKLTEQGFRDGFAGDLPLRTATFDEVMEEVGHGWVGHYDEFRRTPEMRAARRAAQALLGAAPKTAAERASVLLVSEGWHHLFPGKAAEPDTVRLVWSVPDQAVTAAQVEVPGGGWREATAAEMADLSEDVADNLSLQPAADLGLRPADAPPPWALGPRKTAGGDYDMDDPDYVSGECHQYTLALHELTGWPCVLLYDPEEGIVHSAVRAPDGDLLDAGGKLNLKQVGRRYGMNLVAEETTPQGVDLLVGAFDEEIEDAKTVARGQLKKLGVPAKTAKGDLVRKGWGAPDITECPQPDWLACNDTDAGRCTGGAVAGAPCDCQHCHPEPKPKAAGAKAVTVWHGKALGRGAEPLNPDGFYVTGDRDTAEKYFGDVHSLDVPPSALLPDPEVEASAGRGLTGEESLALGSAVVPHGWYPRLKEAAGRRQLPSYKAVMDKRTDKNGEFMLEEDPDLYADVVQKWQTAKFPLEVYRCVALKGTNRLRLRGVGLCWSLDPAIARQVVEELQSHEMYPDVREYVTLKASVAEDAVDWLGTIRAGMTPLEEEEVRLKPGARVRLVAPVAKTVTASSEGTPKTAAQHGPLYHGTPNTFEVFRTTRGRREGHQWSMGAYFTADPEVAKRFAHGSNAEVKKVKLELEKPLDLRALGDDYARLPEALPWLPDGARHACASTCAGLYAKLEMLDQHYGLVPRLKRRGYDGIIFEDPTEGTVYVAFRPGQIKATAGRGLRPNRPFGKGAAPRGIWYHGAPPQHLRAILSQGLIPDPKERNWGSDPDAGMHTPSRESYGGVYVSKNLMTALSAPRHGPGGGGRPDSVVLVAMELQPNTFFLDEDNVVAALNAPLRELSDNEFHVAVYYVAASNPGLNPGYDEACAGMRGEFVERALVKYRWRFDEKGLPWHPGLEARLRGLLPQCWLPALARLAAHAAKRMSDYDYKRAYHTVSGDKVGWDEVPAKADVFPAVDAAEAGFRAEAERVTRAMRLLARGKEGEDPSLSFDTARVPDPIGYAGSNRIVAVAEVRDSRKYRGDDFRKPCPIIVRYGELPADFWAQWKARVGSEVELTRAKAAGAKAAGFAFRSFRKLWHVGTMDPGDKQPGSLEGSGLSVSVDPDEWEDIARIAGDRWELTKPGNKFLNFHRLSRQQREEIADWGVRNGYVTRVATGWRWYFTDAEGGRERYMEFETEQAAREEMDGQGEGEVRPAKGATSLKGTEKLKRRTNNPSADDLVIAFDMLVTVYADDELDCDGVWWQDTHDPSSLSAPRGVIFADRLPAWKRRKTTAGAGKTADTAGFLAEFEAQTTPGSGIGPPHRVREGVSIALERMAGEDKAYVLWVQAHHPNTGKGSQAMRWLCALADKHGVELNLEAEPITGWETLDQRGLIKWYRRFRFRERGYHDNWMTRRPKAKTGAARGVRLPTFEEVTDKSTDTNNEFDVGPADKWEGHEYGRGSKKYYGEAVAALRRVRFPATVHRAFAMRDEDKKIDYARTGLCWSLSREAALATVRDLFDDAERYEVVSGAVDAADVNWLDTVRAWMTLPEEQEIRLRPGAKVRTDGMTMTAALSKTALNVPRLVQDFGRKLLDRWAREFPHGRPELPTTAEDVVGAIADQDPTPNKEYTAWLVGNYARGGIARFEDIAARAVPALKRFHALKTTRRIPVEERDIGRVRGLAALEDLVAGHGAVDTTSARKQEAEREKRFFDDGEAELFYDDAAVRVVIPRTEEASKWFGVNTRWCTAAANNNMFGSYASDGPLYIVLDKAANERYQFHFESGQYMDETDSDLEYDGLTSLFRDHPRLAQLFLPVAEKADSGCSECGGDGTNECGTCDGSGTVDCDYCGGDGTNFCTECDGEGVRTVKTDGGQGEEGAGEEEEEVEEECRYCDGQGRTKCDRCEGGGTFTCGDCDGAGCNSCDYCGGTGSKEADFIRAAKRELSTTRARRELGLEARTAAYKDIGFEVAEGGIRASVLTGKDIKEWANGHLSGAQGKKILSLVGGRALAVLDTMNVVRNRQGRGVGRDFLRRFLSSARAQGAQVALLVADVDTPQPAGIDLVEWYRRAGFREVGTDWAKYPVMLKELGPGEPDETGQEKTSAASEPGLLFRAPEDNGAHDYEPSWDYVVDERPDPGLAALAGGVARGIYARTGDPFELWAVRFTDDEDQKGAVAMYVDGTCGFPVVLIDLEAHRGYEDQIGKSVEHELRHALQDVEGRGYDEDEAESD